MARFTSLPPELIEMICNYIRPMRPMRDRFAETSHENPIDRDGLQLEWRSLRNLSVASRYFRTVIVHGGLLHRALIIKGSFHELFNLLKLFKSAPEFALAVKQLYIHISWCDLGPADLGPGNELPIVMAIKDLGLDYKDARRKILPDSGGPSTQCYGILTDYWAASIWPHGTPVYSEERTIRERCITRYGILVKLILTQMTSLEDIGADIMSSSVLGPRINEYAHREFIPNLSHLRSISLRGPKGSGLYGSALDFLMRLRPVKHLYIDTITSKYNPFFTLVGVLYNVTTLILRDSTFIPKDLEMILRRCAPLSTFKYCVTDGQRRSLSLPCEVVAALRAWHGKTLRTLCLRFLPVGGNNYDPVYSASDSLISSLRGFDVLESLWVDLDAVHGGSSGGPSPANFHTLPWIIGPPESFVERLPGTLKRVFFFVPGRTSGWDDSVVWLARAGDKFPGLTDILYYNAFRNCTFRMVRRRPFRCPFVPALQWD
ncbi:hypothetical protein CKAH01_11740 [Colletotrichum kahawae]|uniref:F-box domain-containing protein n=1 Tax=Colletotrichum kahawae TaxID=34407 RepID=A0AAE0DG35_COLKA|nr:hypothetical protein CKAH01_11740 [Colletotrichum kahawae]